MKLNTKEVNAILATFKETNSGRYGDTFEIVVKKYLNGNRGNSNTVSSKGKTDVTFCGHQCEIKSNCGEITKEMETKEYIIYTMDNKTDIYRCEQAFVVPVADFLAILETVGLIRYNKKNRNQNRVTAKSIQTYNNSKRKTALFYGMLSQYETLESWATRVKAEYKSAR